MLPLLLLHGFPFDSTLWDKTAPLLRATGRHVLTPDLAGFGTTPTLPAPRPDDASIENYAEDIHQLIRHLGTGGGRAIVGGFSMGGYILLALLRAHPQDVAGAIFISTRAEADSPEARAARLQSIADIRAAGTAKLIDTMLTRLLPPNAPAALRAEMRTLMSHQSPSAVIAAQSAMARRRDQSDLLPTLNIPALFLVGTQDTVSPPAVARAMHAKTPHSQLLELPHAAHMTPLESPEQLAQSITHFAAPIT